MMRMERATAQPAFFRPPPPGRSQPAEALAQEGVGVRGGVGGQDGDPLGVGVAAALLPMALDGPGLPRGRGEPGPGHESLRGREAAHIQAYLRDQRGGGFPAQAGDLDGAELSAADEQLLRELTERARTGGLKLTGEGGLLGKLTKMVVEGALEGELDDHLGYGKHDPAGRDGGNSRNGHRAKTVITDTGPVEISVPRDRDASFEPRIVAKRQQRLTGVDDMVISLSSKGLTHGEIAAHLAEVYDAEVSKQTITAITDRVMEGLTEWQSRPLDAVYAVIFIDAINVKIREGQVANRPIYLALGVTVDGERDILGLWAGEHGDGEGAKYWMRVCSEIKNRGTRDVLMVVCDGLKGLPDAVNAVWEKTIVQTCIVHLLSTFVVMRRGLPRPGGGR